MFWRSKQKKELEQFIQGLAESFSEQLQGVEVRLAEQSDSLNEQINKLGRLQVKTSHDISDKLQKLMAGVIESAQSQAKAEQLGIRLATLEQQIMQMVIGNIKFVDDLDMLEDKLADTAQASWGEMFRQWTARLIEQISDVGVREIPVIGMSFDARWCESVGTVDSDEALSSVRLPFEVVKVIRRGFVKQNGDVLRKAEVITVKGVEAHDE